MCVYIKTSHLKQINISTPVIQCLDIFTVIWNMLFSDYDKKMYILLHLKSD